MENSLTYRATEAAFRALVRTFGLLRRVMEPYFAGFGISSAQWGILRTLHRAEEEGLPHLRLSDLGDRLIVRPASITGAIDRLEKLGLVSRTTCAEDQRVKHVCLTDAGRERVQCVLQHHGNQMTCVLSCLGMEEQEQLRELLERLGRHLESLMDGGGPQPDAPLA
jgi:DNA-binding MarR family transcriptional regulator